VKSIAEVLTSIPIKADRFPHLTELSTDAMLLRRVEITGQIKRLEEERKEIGAELSATYSDAELRFGVQFGGGWILKQCQRTSWFYDQQTRDLAGGAEAWQCHSINDCISAGILHKAQETEQVTSCILREALAPVL